MMELRDTVELMVSDDYEERFRAEYWQLRIRKKELEHLIKAMDKGTLDFTPTCPYTLMRQQHKAMEAYFRVLLDRSAAEHIDLGIERCTEREG